MPLKKEPLRVLVISGGMKTKALLQDTLPSNQFSPLHTVSSCGDARRILLETHYDILVINTPLPDEFGVETALDIAHTHSLGILLLVKNEIYDQVCNRVEDFGIVTLPKPISKQTLYVSLKMLASMQYKLRCIEKETLSLKKKMNDIRIITRAKMILIDQLHMTEPQAHHYIEKQAMDRCVKKLEIAEHVIRTYDR